jgi:hypothetical protein
MNEKSRPEAASQDLAGELIETKFTRIDLSANGEAFMGELAVDLMCGRRSLADLTPALRQFAVFFYDEGRASCQATIDKLTATADRLYMAAYGPKDKFDSNAPTYAELTRRRGNPERADQIERDLAAMFAEVTS